MESKLTLQDICKYNKAELIHTETNENFGSITDLLNGESDYDINDFIGEEGEFVCSDCQLILRDITELTDEEKEFILDNYAYKLWHNLSYKSLCFANVTEILTICEDKIGLINYLREKNIMIEPEDWFKSGKAVKG